MTTSRQQGTFFATLAVIAIPTAAQTATIRHIEFNQPKRDRVEDYRKAIAEYNSVLRKGGATTWYTEWSSQTGPAEYLTIEDHATWADLDKPRLTPTDHPELAAELASADQHIREANQTSRRVILRLVPDASLPLGNENPPMIVARWVRLAGRGHGQEYTASIKTELLPAVGKAGIKSYSLWQVWFGTEQSQYLSLLPLDHWALFDQPDPIVTAMGNESYQRYRNKTTPIVAEVREDVYRFRPELSYLPSPARK
jgi:hypothetical protein